MSWQVLRIADAAAHTRQVFVGHPYRLFDMKDYRRTFRSVGKDFGVTFQFADEKITGTHIMDKIRDYINESDFSIFDISGWNPNVTLELGLAWGLGRPFFLLMNPKESKGGDAPSDIKGIDRMDWKSFTELEEQLTKLLAQEYGLKPASSIDQTLTDVRKKVIELLTAKPGMRTEEIAAELNVASAIIKMIMRSLLEEGRVDTSGQRRGTKYTLRQPRKTTAARKAARTRAASSKTAGSPRKKKSASRSSSGRATTRRSTRRSSGRTSTRRASGRSTWRSVARARGTRRNR